MSVQHLTSFDPAREALYLAVREKEGRVWSDDQARRLPHPPPGSVFEKEWRLRRDTYCRYRKHLQKRYGRIPVNMLDVGCGNGWMASLLASSGAGAVWGLDLNMPELEQADRLFAQPNLQFVYADLFVADLPRAYFHQITLAASVQYFPDLSKLMGRLMSLLRPDGEIHVLDSPFYPNETERKAARERTAAYYTTLGFPDMAAHYHHHLRADIEALGGKNLNAGWWQRLRQKTGIAAPFPWYLVK
jgi:2-polyprenyl-3-methyl-5-hydroxy-6-metoxy-1,4-benzoquinol methylase